MKIQIVLVALAALLMPTHGALRQCAGTDDYNRYERSGSMTATLTKNACDASRGWILPDRKGNQKCCNVPDARQAAFNDSCKKQQDNDPNYTPTAQPC